MWRNKLVEDSPILEFINLKIQRQDDVKSLATLEEGEFMMPLDGSIKY